jgi:hypothetical protein
MGALKNKNGSVLVGAVVFSIIAGIAAGGYLAVTNNTVTQEVVALDDARAFHAAESGLLIGTRWLADTTNWNAAITGGSQVVFSDTINGMRVTTTIGPNSGDTIPVVSVAQGGILRYRKQLSWNARIAPGGSGSVINNLDGLVKKGLADCAFEGPIHFNGDIKIFTGAGNKPKFINGPVTVHSSNQLNGDGTAGAAPYYNNYDYGILPDNGVWNLNNIDGCFSALYRHSQPEILNEVSWANAVALDVPNDGLVTFQDGKLSFVDGGGNLVQDTLMGNGGIGKVFLIPGNKSVKVTGTVRGNCSVVTTGAGSITVVDNLDYDGWNWGGADGIVSSGSGKSSTYNHVNNYGLANNTNLISLIASDVGNIKVEITNSKVEGNCIAGFLYAKGGAIELDNSKNNLKNNIFMVGSRSAETVNDIHWNPGKNEIAYLFDRRVPDSIANTGTITNMFFQDATDWIFVLELLWMERNIPN